MRETEEPRLGERNRLDRLLANAVKDILPGETTNLQSLPNFWRFLGNASSDIQNYRKGRAQIVEKSPREANGRAYL